jgi:hypothetical protein
VNEYDKAAYGVVGVVDHLLDGGCVHHRGDGTVALVMTQTQYETLEDYVAQATAVLAVES